MKNRFTRACQLRSLALASLLLYGPMERLLGTGWNAQGEIPASKDKPLPAFLETLARRPAGRWLRWLTGRDPTRYGVGPPLFFHHVPKTAGTSLIKAIGQMVLPELAFTGRGNLSATFVTGLIERGLVPGQFIHGHPRAGAAAPLRGRAHIVTLLREPRDQVISNYLYVRFDRGVADHRVSHELGFREFVLARPRYAIFQTASLHLGIVERPPSRPEDFIDAVPQILAYLDEMALVGVVNQANEFMLRLAGIMGWPRTPRFPHRRKAWVSQKQRERMRDQFAELQNHPMLSPLFAAERTVYLHARSIAERSLSPSSFQNPSGAIPPDGHERLHRDHRTATNPGW